MHGKNYGHDDDMDFSVYINCGFLGCGFLLSLFDDDGKSDNTETLSR
jgi:hypothetical protein